MLNVRRLNDRTASGRKGWPRLARGALIVSTLSGAPAMAVTNSFGGWHATGTISNDASQRYGLLLAQAIEVTSEPREWTKPDPRLTSKPTTLSAKTRKVKIQFVSDSCDRGFGSKIVRSKKTVVIRFSAQVASFDGPYLMTCGGPTYATRIIGLKGRLGHRNISDGFSKPPKVRYRHVRSAR